MNPRVMWVMILFLLLGASVHALSIDLGDLTVRNPRITLNFSDPSHLEIYTLTRGNTAYPLCVRPSVTSSTFDQIHELYTTTARNAECTDGTPQHLVPGTYLLTVQGSDIKGNLTPLYVFQFNISGLEIKLTSPKSNVTPFNPPRINFTTTRLAPTLVGQAPVQQPVNATCRYTITAGRTWEQMTPVGPQASAHAIEISHQGNVYAICKESAGAGQEAGATFRIGFDLTPPRITGVTRSPQLVTTLTGMLGITNIRAITDEAAVCELTGLNQVPQFNQQFFDEIPGRYETYTTSHDVRIEYDPVTVGTTAKNFSYLLTCENLAGTRNSTRFNITVDFSKALSIQVLEPQSVINDVSFDLVVRPVLIADPSRVVKACNVTLGSSTVAMTKNSITQGETVVTVFTAPFSFNPDGSQDGRKEFRITCKDDDTMQVFYNVTIDSRGPKAPTINTSAIICDGNISARFNSTDHGLGIAFYNYTVSDDEGVLHAGQTSAGRASFRPTKPLRGQLSWQVFAVDIAGNVGSTTTAALQDAHMGTDEECGLPPFITLRSPGAGFATDAPYDLEIGTSRTASCRYSFLSTAGWTSMTPIPTADRRTHILEDLKHHDVKNYYVACNETGVEQLHRRQFKIGVDETPPVIALRADQAPVIDRSRKIVTLTITTDDLTYCSINGEQIPDGPPTEQSSYARAHVVPLDFRDITDPQRQEIEYDISCKNLAHLESSKTYTAVVHFGADFVIEILSPPFCTNRDDVTLTIKPSKTGVCSYTLNGTEHELVGVNGTLSANLGFMAQGGHTVPVFCIASDSEASNVSSFTIDKSIPGISDLRGPKELCIGDTVSYYFNISGLDPEPVIKYSVVGTNRTENLTTLDRIINIDSEEYRPGTYTLTVAAVSCTNASGEKAAYSFEILNRSACAQNRCENGKLDPGEEAIDCGGVCDPCESCQEDLDCSPGNICGGDVCIPKIDCTTNAECASGICSAGVCVANTTNTICIDADDCGTGEQCISGMCEVVECTISDECGAGEVCEDYLCVSSEIECTNNNECDIGEVCSAGKCMVFSGCTTSNDCGFGKQCISGVCIEDSSCDTDSDCGTNKYCKYGTCTPKPITEGCTADLECDGGTCVEGYCTPPEEEESHLLSIMLIAFGVAIMGGAGYFLYQQHGEKSASSRTALPQYPQRPSGQLAPALAAHYEQNAEVRQAALSQEYARRQAEQEKRNSVFQNFGDARKQVSSPQARPVQPVQKKTEEKTDEYVELSAVKKPKDGAPKKGKEDAFDELEKL